MEKTKLKIHIWPDKSLRARCKQAQEVTPQIIDALDEMYSFMKINDGVGLAANQVGIDRRLVVVEWNNEVFQLIAPEITKRNKDKISSTEGCLSFPGIELSVKRATEVEVSALNRRGERITIKGKGILAIIFQHEIDHLNGVVFIDRVSFWRRLLLRKKLKNLKTHDA